MKRYALILILAALFAACSEDRAPLVASDVIITRPLPGMQMTGGYLTLTNNTSQRIKITHVTSPQFASVEMHESVVEDGVARMYELGDLTILAGDSVHFERGGKHLMLMNPIDDNESVTLDFHSNTAVILTVNVALTE